MGEYLTEQLRYLLGLNTLDWIITDIHYYSHNYITHLKLLNIS